MARDQGERAALRVLPTGQRESVSGVVSLSALAEGTVIGPAGRWDRRAYRPLPHDPIGITGDHFTVLEDHADLTAATIADRAAGLSG